MIRVTKLFLTNFRNFSEQRFGFDSEAVLFVGENGVGKTNVLEGLSLLGRNGSLCSADFDEIVRIGEKNFTIYAEISGHEFIEKIAISFDATQKKKNLLINGEPVSPKRQSDLKNHLINFIFLTPQLEQLFILGKSDRRDYLDKIVSDLDSSHLLRIGHYQKLLKERLLILQKHHDERWLKVVEEKIVELGVSIAAARIEAVDFFNKAIASFASNFPQAKLCVSGEVEEMIAKQSAAQLEEFYKIKMKENRERDLVSFKTEFGVHRSDFDAIFLAKNISAKLCSTGEQKAIMIGITLARARISSSYKNQPTIMIFDEVVSHLDAGRKKNLFTEISTTKLQTFFSATSADLIPTNVLSKMISLSSA
ncbi:MAG: DNA replication and repair protein RecF [Alphaproteobacteria bacterium]|nr:DNA replication and repair protein RecF [Alphaproteobacteria bacterium]